MDAAIDRHWAFERIAVLLLALAVLAERAAGGSGAVRCLVLFLLRPAAEVARAFAAEAGYVLVDCPALEPGVGPGDAARLAEDFRALAAFFHALSAEALRWSWETRQCGSACRPRRRPKVAWLHALPIAFLPRYADTS